ncbi:MAG: flavin monoamine oxidase family protein [Xanthobacteraceae bacterium]
MPKITRRQVVGGAGSAILIGGAGIDPVRAVPNTTSRLTADVCIVGAGFAGLAAAWRLKQAGASVVVLEATPRVGGRSYTVTLPDKTFVDWGGQWVGPTQDRFYALIKEMGAETYPSPNIGRALQRSIVDAARYDRLDESKDENYPGAGEIKAVYDKLDALAESLDVNAPWTHKEAARFDSLTYAEWLRQNVENEAARHFCGVEVGSVPCASPEEISILHLAWMLKACRGIGKLFVDAQQDRIVGGTQPVARRLAQRLGGDVVKTREPVRRIEWNDKGALVQSDNVAVQARHVIIAIPPNLANGIEFEPSLPTNRVQVTQRWPQGLVIKVAMVYPTPFWRDDGLSGTSFDPLAVMSETADSSNPENVSKAGILTGFVYSDQARKVSPLAEDDRKKLLLGEMVQRFGPRAAAPVNYHESNWTMAPWTRGCFTGFLTPGATALLGPAMREPVGPIRWAGTETATHWPSFIDGAIRSGEREAAAVRAA